MTRDGATPLEEPEGPRARRVTSSDVARVSGVSRTTVSYVLNDAPGVSISAETRAHVLATAARLEYRPSAAARTLRRGRSDLVLVLLPRWVSSAVTEAFLDQLESRLSVAGLTMLVYYGGARGRLAGVWRAVTPRAVISASPFTAAERRELRQAGVQALTIGESSEGSSDATLQERIGRMQVDYLAQAGHRRIAIATSSDAGLQEFAEPRLGGARQRCVELGLIPPLVAAVDLEVEGTRSVVVKWRRTRPPVTAVAAYNDEVALAVLGAAQTERIRVPEDLAIIGVDDLRAGRLVVPALTTVVQAGVELEAQYLAARVIQEPADSAQPRQSLDEPLSVVVRGSA